MVLRLATLPGYFSFDELHWAHYARSDWGTLPWQGWLDVASFQYRPLTFNSWLVLAKLLHESPRVFHLVYATLAGLNAVLLYHVARRSGCTRALASGAAALFLLSPHAVYVMGWVGTLADVLWLAGLLAIWLLALGELRRGALIAASIGFTAAALLAKEAAVAIPAVLLGLALLHRHRRLAWAGLAALVPVAAYLALRLSPVLSGAHEASGYAWSVSYIPHRVVDYLVYPFLVARLEPQGIADTLADVRLVSWSLFAVVLVGSALRRIPRGGWIPLILLAALGPVLILHTAAAQYAYGASGLAFVFGALAWKQADRGGRAALIVLALISSWHGLNNVRAMARVATLQAAFTPALATAAEQSELIRLHPECAKELWVYRRLSYDLPQYREGSHNRVEMADSRAEASHLIACDGTLRPI